MGQETLQNLNKDNASWAQQNIDNYLFVEGNEMRRVFNPKPL